MIFLTTPRLTLRNVADRDAAEMFDYRNNELCAKYQRGQVRELDQIAALIARRKNDALTCESPSLLSVALKDTDAMIGEIVVMPGEGTISLGYTFSYRIHRQGYAFEALSALITHLHARYPDWDFVCFTDPENAPSRALLLKLGYADLGYVPSNASEAFGKWLRPDTLDELRQAVQPV